MLKLLFLIVGLAVGFGGGVYWGVHHPEQASQLSQEEERRFLELQIKTTEAVKNKLDQIASKQSGKSFGSGFVSGGSSGSAPDPDIAAVREQSDKQLQELHQHLDQLKK